jgi:hypothetical protein
VQQHSGGGLPPADPPGGDRQRRILDLVHDLDSLPGRESLYAYALANRSDWGLAACFAINALCCLAIAYWKRRSHARRALPYVGPSALSAT